MIEIGDGFAFDWDEVRELRREIERGGMPDDPDDVRARFVRLVENAEGLRVLFGGSWDEASRRECLAALVAIRGHRAWDRAATHRGTGTRQ